MIQKYVLAFLKEYERDSRYGPLASMERQIMLNFAKWMGRKYKIVIVPIDKLMICPTCGQELNIPEDDNE